MEDDVVEWITINHQHVPIKKGETKREVARNFIKNKMSRVEKNKDKYDKIAKFKKRKETNSKFDNQKLKYNVSKDGNKYTIDDEQRRQVEKKMGINQHSKEVMDFEVRGNTYIPIRKGENRQDVIKDYEKRENIKHQARIKEAQDTERDLQSGYHIGTNDDEVIKRAKKDKGKLVDYDRRANLIKYAQENKEQINKWVSEYDDETHKRVGEKVLRQEPLTAKEYFGFMGSDPKPGSVILEEFPDGENAVVANDGNLVRQSRIKEYNKNPKANQDAVYSQKDDDEWDRILEEENSIKNYSTWDERHKNDVNPFNKEQKEKIDKFKKRKKSNK